VTLRKHPLQGIVRTCRLTLQRRGHGRRQVLIRFADAARRVYRRELAPLRWFVTVEVLFRTTWPAHEGVFAETPEVCFADVGRTAQLVLPFRANTLTQASSGRQQEGCNKKCSESTRHFPYGSQ